jgi:hypothetical protein
VRPNRAFHKTAVSLSKHTNHFHNLLLYLNFFSLNKMKLHLLLLPSLFHLSSGFMAELRGPLTEAACTGEDSEEYADFRHCVTEGVAIDQNLSALDESELDDLAFMNHKRDDDRRLQLVNWCRGCRGGAPKGTFCFTVCGGRRRLSEEGNTDMETPNLRRLEKPDFVAVFENGAYSGNGKAKQIAKATIKCLGDVSMDHPCLGSTETMVLTITL